MVLVLLLMYYSDILSKYSSTDSRDSSVIYIECNRGSDRIWKYSRDTNRVYSKSRD